MEQAERLDQAVQSFLRANPREVADRERLMRFRIWRSRMTDQIDSQWHAMNFASRNLQQVAHVLAVIFAVRQESIKLLRSLSNQG